MEKDVDEPVLARMVVVDVLARRDEHVPQVVEMDLVVTDGELRGLGVARAKLGDDALYGLPEGVVVPAGGFSVKHLAAHDLGQFEMSPQRLLLHLGCMIHDSIHLLDYDDLIASTG